MGEGFWKGVFLRTKRAFAVVFLVIRRFCRSAENQENLINEGARSYFLVIGCLCW